MDGNVLPKGGRKITHMVDLEYRDGVLMKCVHVLDIEVDPETGCENRVFVGDVWMPVSDVDEYQVWFGKARGNGWVIPFNHAFRKESWVAYWKQCDEYERNPDSGRPVPPHRSA